MTQKRSYRWDEKAGAFVEIPPATTLRYSDLCDAEEAVKRRQEEQRESAAHPGTYL